MFLKFVLLTNFHWDKHNYSFKTCFKCYNFRNILIVLLCVTWKVGGKNMQGSHYILLVEFKSAKQLLSFHVLCYNFRENVYWVLVKVSKSTDKNRTKEIALRIQYFLFVLSFSLKLKKFTCLVRTNLVIHTFIFEENAFLFLHFYFNATRN